MRFHIGFSKYICIKALIKWGLLILTCLFAFFGIDNIFAKAYINNSPVQVQQCGYDSLFGSSECVSQTPLTKQGIVGWFTNYSSYQETTSNVKAEKKSIHYQYLGSTSGDCSTSQQVTFYADLLLDTYVSNSDSPDNTFPPQALNPNSWATPTTRGTVLQNRATSYIYNNYWQYISSWYDTNNLNNQLGLRVYGVHNGGFAYGTCNFVSYGTNKSVRFRCNVDAKQDSYWISANLYNQNGAYYNYPIKFVSSIYVSNVNDPCANTNSGDLQGVVDQIVESTFNITDSIYDNSSSIENSINNNSNTINGNLNDIKNKQDTTNNLLQDIKANTQNSGNSGGDSTNCNKLNVQQMKNTHGKQLDLSNGTLIDNVNYTVTDYTMFTSIKSLQGWSRICFYDTLKGFLSCQDSLNGTTLNIPTGAVYFRFSYSSGIDPNNVNVHYCSNLYGGESIDPFNSSDYNGGYSDSQVMQDIINLPFDLVQMVLNNVHTCGNYRIDLSSITRRWGGYDYTLVLPCIRNKVKTLMGDEWYNLFDYIMCAVVFYYFAMNVYLKVDSITSGGDGFPTFFKSKGRTTSYYNAHVDDSTGEVTR